jgi:hypothetical protein
LFFALPHTCSDNSGLVIACENASMATIDEMSSGRVVLQDTPGKGRHSIRHFDVPYSAFS